MKPLQTAGLAGLFFCVALSGCCNRCCYRTYAPAAPACCTPYSQAPVYTGQAPTPAQQTYAAPTSLAPAAPQPARVAPVSPAAAPAPAASAVVQTPRTNQWGDLH